MSNTSEKLIVELGHFPKKSLEILKDSIVTYGVGLFNIYPKNEDKKYRYCGSGTLVSLNEDHFILTAAHVWELLKETELIALTLTEKAHCFTLKLYTIIPYIIYDESNLDWGPDLALLQISNTDVKTILAYKNFYNFSKRAEKYLSEDLDIEMGLWSIQGAPGETSEFYDEGAILDVRSNFSGVAETHIKNGFDYLDIIVRYDRHPDLPLFFGGLSGGGLWHFKFGLSEEKQTIYWDNT